MILVLGLPLLALAQPNEGVSADLAGLTPVEARFDKAEYAHFYRLFSDLAHIAPTRLQPELMAEAEAIWQITEAWRLEPATEADHAAVSKASRQLCERLRGEYPTLALTYGSGELPSPEVVALARGLTRVMLVEVANTTSEEVVLAPRLGSDLPPCAPAEAIPAGQSRWFLLPMLAETTALTGFDIQFVDEAAKPVLAFQLPVTVVEPARLTGTLIEASTGQPFPGRVRVYGSDGLVRHGEAFKANSTLSEKPVVFRPAWYKLPFFYSDGHFEVLVPPGPTQITLERGFEHPLVTQGADLAAGETRAITLTSARELDMKDLGWISGDTHIHWAINAWDQNEDLALLAMVQRAEDLRVANNLTLYQWRSAQQGGPFTKPDQRPMGLVADHSDDDYLIWMGEEYRNDNHWGHINLLGITDLVQPIATGPGSGGPHDAFDYPLNKTAILEAHRQGGISLEAHNLGPFGASDVPVNVIQGLADGLDQLEPEHYYRFLDCGFHIGLGNGSDHPARVAGCVRTYVQVEGDFTYRAWLDGLKAGRTFTTSGPLLLLTVEGQGPGSTLDIEAGQQLAGHLKAWSRHPLGQVEVVANHQVVASLNTEDNSAELDFELTPSESLWVVARASRDGKFDALNSPDAAHTSAIYLRVDGREAFRRESAEFWVNNLTNHIENVKRRGQFENEAQLQEALDYLNKALVKYQRLLETEGLERPAAWEEPAT